jgi:hypothetical protein
MKSKFIAARSKFYKNNHWNIQVQFVFFFQHDLYLVH